MKKCVFHIVPMLNPDGVVMGNFRTSLYGKDLNRLFSSAHNIMTPEVEFCRDIVYNLTKSHSKGKLLMFLDIHGHSVRRNTFCYGPGIVNNSFEDIREFPRIISQLNEIFRFPSCSFRVSSHKKSTARAMFGRIIGLCYTIESSNWSYMLGSRTSVKDFTIQKWNEVGNSIGEAIFIFVSGIIERKNRLKLKKQSSKAKKGLSEKKKENKSQGKKEHLKTLIL